MSIQAGKQGVGTSPGHGISLTQNPGGYKLGPFQWSNVDPDSGSKWFDPDSGSMKCNDQILGQSVLTMNPGQVKFELTRNPGHLNWPGIRVIWIDPESGSEHFDTESGSKHLNIQKDLPCTQLDSRSTKCHDQDLYPHLANQKHHSLSPVHLTTRPLSPQKWHLRPLLVLLML